MKQNELNTVQRQRMLRWILALEGKAEKKYTQTENMLHSMEDGGFCCLGVACDVYNPNGWYRHSAEKAKMVAVEFLRPSCDTQMPQEVADWYGVVDTDPWLTGWALADGSVFGLEGRHEKVKRGERITVRASTWNDNQGASFAQIAAMLRENFDIHEQEDGLLDSFGKQVLGEGQ